VTTSRLTRRRLWLAVAVGLVVAVVAAGLAIATSEEPVDRPPCWAVLEAQRDLGPGPVTDGSPTIAVLGDSYSLGIGVSGPEAAWPAALGGRLGAEVFVDGVGGTGFTTRGFCPDDPITYGERVAADPPDAEIVVVQGSVNDALGGRPDDVGEAARELLGDLEGVPTVVVVGVPVIPAAEAAELRAIDAALLQAAEEAGRVHVPLVDAGIAILPDRVHPTLEGQQRIAELVAAAIGAAGA
jgi:lysophospholipase L1-like esterase